MLTLLLSCGLLAASDLSGQVVLKDGKPARNAVVWLEGKEKGVPLKKAVIDQRDRKFSPHLLVVTVGTKVDFPNNDVIFRNVFSEYHAERFDFGIYPRGKSKSQVFDREGVAALLCSIHPDMSAYVVCVDTPYYLITDKNGAFKFANVPEGSYVMKGWQESGQSGRQSVQVGASGTITLRLSRD